MFWRRKQITCPYCLTVIHSHQEITKCLKNKCGKTLPARYVQEHKNAPPIFVQLMGWTNVGKTTYLQALTVMLLHLNKLWPQSYASAPLTNVTLKYTRDVRTSFATGEMPLPTQLNLQDAYIMLLEGMERWGGRTLVTQDVAGEHFNNLNFIVEYMPYVLHVPITFLMISRPDLKKSNMAMDELMNSYIDTMARHDPRFREKRRKVIVVLSKADKFFDELPENLQEYLVSDPIVKGLNRNEQVKRLDAIAMQKYMDKLARVSLVIRNWISQDASAQNLIALANNNNIQLEFTIVSSTGADVTEGENLAVKRVPRRVLDPFFWALEFQSL